MKKPVESLPNIGPELASNLRDIGVSTAEDLLAIGAAKAWEGLVRSGLRQSVQSLLILEGAIEGVRWNQVSLERKQELKAFAISFSQGN